MAALWLTTALPTALPPSEDGGCPTSKEVHLTPFHVRWRVWDQPGCESGCTLLLDGRCSCHALAAAVWVGSLISLLLSGRWESALGTMLRLRDMCTHTHYVEPLALRIS